MNWIDYVFLSTIIAITLGFAVPCAISDWRAHQRLKSATASTGQSWSECFAPLTNMTIQTRTHMATQTLDTIAEHYYECHITIAPIFDEARERVKTIAAKYKFKLATLLMQKRAADTPERSRYDTFMTSHGKSLIDINDRMVECVNELLAAGFDVYRYKIEDIVMESRIHDFHQLLRAGQLTHLVAWSGNIKLSMEGPATFAELQQLVEDPSDVNRIGYLMDGPDGRFVTTTEALSIALKSGQYTGPRPPDGVLTPELLWGVK